MKDKVDILDVDELVPVPADLIKVSDVWKKNVIKKRYILLRSKILKINYLIKYLILLTELLILLLPLK